MSVEKKVCLITFGCQMNEYDTGRLAELLAGRGCAKKAAFVK
jgi:tRNA A37 methylthiotransferase MiaB